MIGIDTTVLVHLEIRESPEHLRTHELLHKEVFEGGQELALAPQVLTEFLHIVTDPRRFQRALSMPQALDKALFWWNAAEVRRIFPSSDSVALFLDWLTQHQLGRKRLLDIHLAATLWCAGVRRLMTANPRDFAIFPGFELLSP
jgi:predicted nucleic acid-binding protein